MSWRRRSSRSVLAKAFSTAFLISWPRARSATSRAIPVFAHQFRNELRIPCGTQLMLVSLQSLLMVALLRVRPVGDGKTRPWPPDLGSAVARTARAPVLSGTRCPFSVLVCCGGIVQVAVVRSISSHVAFLTSPLRVAVRVRNLNAAIVAQEARWLRQSGQHRRLGCGVGPSCVGVVGCWYPERR